jgi:hypothetical protein
MGRRYLVLKAFERLLGLAQLLLLLLLGRSAAHIYA